MGIKLFDYQKDALDRMSIGCILCGGVGSGKSITALSYYFTRYGGKLDPYEPMDDKDIPDLYIITTARKRDTLEWEKELCPFLLGKDGIYSNNVIVDSWNNITKYKDISNAFFIFDEQRVVGTGAWVKAFLKITKTNDWILLSATPGDNWSDYMPVFVANGFYRNFTEFKNEHIVYSPYSKNFPKIDRYVNTGRLMRLRNKILVNMDYSRKAECIEKDIWVDYNIKEYKELMKNRWNKEKDLPIANAAELCYALRKIVNSDASRINEVQKIFQEKRRIIVFYNFDYELEILKSQRYFVDTEEAEVAEWNGHKHQPIPDSNYWVYLVQYTAGAEGWNCIKTDTMVFYSQNYSYKVKVQSMGRIDRLNTPYRYLYYYHLKSKSGIDLAISKALREKKKFNEGRFVNFKSNN